MKMKSEINYLKIVLFTFAIMIFLCAQVIVCFAASDESDDSIRVGYFISNGCQEGIEDNVKSGYGYEYLQKISYYTGWKYEYIHGEYNELVEKLKDGEIDLMGNVLKNETNQSDLLLSKNPEGNIYSYLFLNAYDDKYTKGKSEKEVLSGIRIGVILNTNSVDMVNKWCESHSIDADIITFEDKEKLLNALENRSIDGIVSNEFYEEYVFTYNLLPYAKIGYEAFYFACPKNKKEIINKIDNAMNNILSNNPNYNSYIYGKYMNEGKVIDSILSDEETSYLATKTQIRVGYLYDYMPFCTLDTNKKELTGVLKDILYNIERNYGISFSTVCYYSYNEMLEDLSQDKVDLMFPVMDSIWMAEKENIYLTEAIANSTMVLLYKGDYETDLTTSIAVSKSSPFQKKFVEMEYPNAKIYECESFEACLNAVKNGKAKSTVMLNNCYQVDIKNITEVEMLNAVPLNTNIGISFGVNRKQLVLLEIINKSLNVMDKSVVDDALVQYTKSGMKYSLVHYIKSNPKLVFSVAVVSVAVVSIAFIIYIGLINRSRRSLLVAKTEAEYAKTEALEAEMEAINANIAKTDFLSRIAHDIKSPINNIMKLIDVADRNKDNISKVQECHDKIHISTVHLMAMLNDVLDIRKLESGGNEYSEVQFDLLNVLDECVDITKMQAKEQGIYMDVRFRDSLEVRYLVGCPLHIRQIFINVLANAILYNKKNGTILCTCEMISHFRDSVVYKFVIADTGIGMSNEILDKIFDSKVSLLDQEKGKTVGSGLYIVKKLIGQLGGSICCESEEGIGTTISMTIPFKIDHTPHEDVQIDKSISLDGLKILAAEDNEINAEIIQYHLNKAGVIVDKASDGREALDKYLNSEDEEYDMILMDSMMPKLDGMSIIKMIRNSKKLDAKTIPIIAMMPDSSRNEIEKAKEAGANEYLLKPIEVDQMIIVLGKCQSMIRKNRENEKNESIKNRVENLKYQAIHDAFTDVLTKSAFFELVDEQLSMQENELSCLMVLDLDNFKHVNDKFGHKAGDEAILKLVDILKKKFDKTGLIGRFGGDEFMIYLKNIADIKDVEQLAGEVLVDVETGFRGKYEGAHITVSMGMSFTDDYLTAEELFKLSDSALYNAKEQGKNRYCMENKLSYLH